MSPLQTSSSAVLEANGVSFQAGGRLLVDGVSFSLRPGRLVGLVGPNGSGKSTLLRLINGLLPASAGSVLLGGEPIGQLQPQTVARRVARVPQSPPGELDFTVLDVVLMGRYAHSEAWQETPADRTLALEALGLTRTDHLKDRLYSTLSGGERQRVAVARALAQEPKVLMLDEATANLDLRHQFEVMEVVRRLTLQQQVAAIAAIHDLTLAARYCDELLLLHGGRAVAAGEPSYVLTPQRLRVVFGVDTVVERHSTLGHLIVLVQGLGGG